MGAKLEGEALEQALGVLSGWTVKDGKLHRVFVFTDFIEAFGFMAQVALVAERMDHHPEWCNVYKTVAVSLSTHDAGGLTQKDMDLAHAINRLAGFEE